MPIPVPIENGSEPEEAPAYASAQDTPARDELKMIIIHFLVGKSLAEIKLRLTQQSIALNKSGKDIYKSISLKNVERDRLLCDLLYTLKLDIKSAKTRTLLAKTDNLYDLLKLLAHNDNHHVKYLLNLINNTKEPKNWGLIFLFGTFLTSLLGSLLYFNRETVDKIIEYCRQTFPFVVNWLGRTFSLLRNLQLIGIINTSLRLLWSWRQTFSNGGNSNSHKFYILLFNTVTAGLTIAGYTLSYFAGGTLTFSAATLFVLSSGIELFKSLYYLIKANNMYSNLRATPPTEKDTWETWYDYARTQNIYFRALNTFIIWFIAAACTVVAVGIWNFYPPNFIITVTCLIVIPLISWTKSTIIASINERYAASLQADLEKIPSHLKPHNINVQKLERDKLRIIRSSEKLLREKDSLKAQVTHSFKLVYDAFNIVEQSARSNLEKLYTDEIELVSRFEQKYRELAGLRTTYEDRMEELAIHKAEVERDFEQQRRDMGLIQNTIVLTLAVAQGRASANDAAPGLFLTSSHRSSRQASPQPDPLSRLTSSARFFPEHRSRAGEQSIPEEPTQLDNPPLVVPDLNLTTSSLT